MATTTYPPAFGLFDREPQSHPMDTPPHDRVLGASIHEAVELQKDAMKTQEEASAALNEVAEAVDASTKKSNLKVSSEAVLKVDKKIIEHSLK